MVGTSAGRYQDSLSSAAKVRVRSTDDKHSRLDYIVLGHGIVIHFRVRERYKLGNAPGQSPSNRSIRSKKTATFFEVAVLKTFVSGGGLLNNLTKPAWILTFGSATMKSYPESYPLMSSVSLDPLR